MRWSSLVSVAVLALGAHRALAEPAPVGGGAWRSILPTGTGRELVQVMPYRLDRVPVTNAQYAAFVQAHPDWQRGRAPVVLADASYLHHWRSAGDPRPASVLQQPVTSVSWFAARAYCESQGGRLPTWYEWEFAAAADEHSPDARRDAQWQQRILSWYSRPSNRPLEGVGLQPANLYGIHDLHGLVWEWVEDFNALMISGDSREQGDPDILKFCGTGALALESRDDYALAMRLAMLSSLQANGTTVNVGFRCAYDDTGKLP